MWVFPLVMGALHATKKLVDLLSISFLSDVLKHDFSKIKSRGLQTRKYIEGKEVALKMD
jgi:hypothetical protein